MDEGYPLYVQFLSIFETSFIQLPIGLAAAGLQLETLISSEVNSCWWALIGDFVHLPFQIDQMADDPSEDLQRSDLSEESELLARHRKEVKDLRGT